MVTCTISATRLSFVGPNAFTLYTTDVSDGLLLRAKLVDETDWITKVDVEAFGRLIGQGIRQALVQREERCG